MRRDQEILIVPFNYSDDKLDELINEFTMGDYYICPYQTAITALEFATKYGFTPNIHEGSICMSIVMSMYALDKNMCALPCGQELLDAITDLALKLHSILVDHNCYSKDKLVYEFINRLEDGITLGKINANTTAIRSKLSKNRNRH